MVRAGPLMARAAVRTFGVVIVLCALHRKLRRRALTLFIVGTAYRWRSTRVRVADIPSASPTTSLTGGRHERRGTIALTWRAEAAHHEVDARLRNVLGLKPGAATSDHSVCRGAPRSSTSFDWLTSITAGSRLARSQPTMAPEPACRTV